MATANAGTNASTNTNASTITRLAQLTQLTQLTQLSRAQSKSLHLYASTYTDEALIDHASSIASLIARVSLTDTERVAMWIKLTEINNELHAKLQAESKSEESNNDAIGGNV